MDLMHDRKYGVVAWYNRKTWKIVEITVDNRLSNLAVNLMNQVKGRLNRIDFYKNALI